ncbi:MAG: ABC transporter permease [Flavobacteriaceae bacterium]|nr:ABC transporter permease [Flavobacteriaceae bacterium]
MRNLKYILQKEFRQIFRDKTILIMMLMLPLIQLILIPMAMDYEVKQLNLVLIDNDNSSFSQKLTAKLAGSRYFHIQSQENTFEEAIIYLNSGEADAILHIPSKFEKHLIRESSQKLGLFVDAINGTKSGLGSAYIMAVIQDFNQEIQIFSGNAVNPPQKINVQSMVWYNPLANYYWFSVPGVLVLLLTIVGGFLSALNIVREKEVGTIEQINVSPVKKWQFILGKMIPFWITGLIVLTLGLVIARLVYGLVPQGSLLVLYALSAIYLIAILGFGLIVSSVSHNQLQSMFIAYFFIMVFIMLSGLFTSVESMPNWAQSLADFLPITHFMKAVRMIMVKGSGFADLIPIFIYEIIFALVLNLIAVWSYRKKS